MQEKKPSPKDFFKRFTKKSPPKTAKHTAKGPNQRMRQRAAVLIIVILVIGFGATLLRLGLLTVVQGSDLQERAVDQQLADTTLTAKRGTIYDESGNVTTMFTKRPNRRATTRSSSARSRQSSATR